MAHDTDLSDRTPFLLNIGRAATLAAIASFALPWLTFQGLGRSVLGFQLLTGQLGLPPGEDLPSGPNVVVIISALSALAALGFSFLARSRRAAAAALVACWLAIIFAAIFLVSTILSQAPAYATFGAWGNLVALIAAAVSFKRCVSDDWREELPPSIRPYAMPRPIAALLLGITSGFPLALLLGTMTFWLTKVGIDKKTIGFAVGLTTPYTLKFLWAPFIDTVKLPVLTGLFGQRRAWLFFIMALLFGAVWMLGFSDPANNLGRFAFWAIVVAFLGATQDIVIDAYRIEILPDDELPHGTANNQFGYRLGAFFAGVGTIAMASPEGFGLGWERAYGLTALCVIPGIIAAMWAGPGLHDKVLAKERIESFGKWLKTTIVGPFREFLRRRGAVLILLFVLVYKLGDAMGQIMLNPMIVELGFSDTEFIVINKGVGFWGLIVGVALAPPFMAWLGMGRALFASGLLMMVSNGMFAILALQGHSNLWLTIAVVTEQVTSGMGLTVFVTYLSGLSNLAYTATQFALLSSFAAVGRTWLSTPAGIAAEELGWPGFWLMTMAVAVPGLVLLWILWRRGFVVDTVRQPKSEDDETGPGAGKPQPAAA